MSTPTPHPVRPIHSAEPNHELLTMIDEFLQEVPERHDQATWINGRVRIAAEHPEARGADLLELLHDTETCGTAGCFAGWAAIAAGWRQVSMWDEVVDPTDPYRRHHLTMREAAIRSLGITRYQAAVLFDSMNSRADIHEIVYAIVNGDEETLTRLGDCRGHYRENYGTDRDEEDI